MPRTTKNGNGHKQPKIEDFEMVSPAPTAEHEAITLPQEEITWEEALKLTGCLSRALLVLRLAPMIPDVDVDGLTAIPLAFQVQLEEIKAQIVAEESAKKLGASVPQKFALPLLESTDDLAIVNDEPPVHISKSAKKSSKGRLTKQETAEVRKQNAELTVAKIKETAKARKQRLAREEADRTEKLQQIKEVAAVEVVEEFLVAQETREEVLTALGDKQSDEETTHYEQKITAVNERLSQIGSKLRITKAEDLKQQKEDYVTRNQEHQDFFTTLADAWAEEETEEEEV